MFWRFCVCVWTMCFRVTSGLCPLVVMRLSPEAASHPPDHLLHVHILCIVIICNIKNTCLDVSNRLGKFHGNICFFSPIHLEGPFHILRPHHWLHQLPTIYTVLYWRHTVRNVNSLSYYWTNEPLYCIDQVGNTINDYLHTIYPDKYTYWKTAMKFNTPENGFNTI